MRHEDEREELERAQDALRESEERYHSLVDLSPDGIVVYNEKGYIVFANPAVCTILRCTPKALQGKPISDLISQDSRELEIKRLGAMLEVGTLLGFVEEKWVRLDGSPVDVEVASVTIVYEGKPAVQTVVRDITERKMAERALRESEERLELALTAAGLGSWDCNLRTKEQVYDQRWAGMLGYSVDEIESDLKSWIRLMHPDDAPKMLKAFREHFDGRADVYEIEYRLKAKTGVWKWILSRGKIVERDELGWPVRMIGAHLDVTERKQAEELLAHRSLQLAERVKELNCLYGISRIVEDQSAPLDTIIEKIVNLIPAAWRYPELACSRIILEGREFITERFRESPWALKSHIDANGTLMGTVEVRYLEEMPESEEGPFSREERRLIDEIAERLGRIVERFRAQTALKESEERFRAIFESAVESMFLKDRSLAFTLVNPATERLLGVNASRILGRHSEDFFDRKTADHLNQSDFRVLAGESVEEERVVPIRGEILTLHIIRVPLRDADGTIVGLCGIMRNITERRKLVREEHRVTAEDYPSPAMHGTLQKARIAAQTDSIILLQGESGSGKDYLARWIHLHSSRAAGPFFAINCAAVARELAESELFGHERGAFTGASGQKKGLLELAEGGTILLNEIGELDLSIQAKLLVFLDTRSFMRVGGQKHVSVNARLVAASHRDLMAEVEEGRFLRPLYYRLSVFPIRVPPLRERIEDLLLLVREIASALAAEMQLSVVPPIDSDHIAVLARYQWPGNIRELRNVLERSLILWEGGRLTLALPSGGGEERITDSMPQTSRSRSLEEVVDEAAAAACLRAIQDAGGNKTEAAQILGISRGALYRQLKRLGIELRDRTKSDWSGVD